MPERISQGSTLIRGTVIIFNPALCSHSIVNLSYANKTPFHEGNKCVFLNFKAQGKKRTLYPINKP